MQAKYQVLALSEIQSSQPNAPRAWTRRALQVFTGKVAGQVTFYAPREELEALQVGYYLVDIEEGQGDRGAIEFRIVKVQPVAANQKAVA
jgi:hypothetical protein